MSIELFGALAGEVGTVLERQSPGSNYEELEPILEKIVDLVQRNPNLKRGFEREYIKLLELKNMAAPEILQYSMHILKWDTVLDAAKELRDSSDDVRRVRVYEGILESFSSDWENRDLFERFRES